jgi:hypothetical protein
MPDTFGGHFVRGLASGLGTVAAYALVFFVLSEVRKKQQVETATPLHPMPVLYAAPKALVR